MEGQRHVSTWGKKWACPILPTYTTSAATTAERCLGDNKVRQAVSPKNNSLFRLTHCKCSMWPATRNWKPPKGTACHYFVCSRITGAEEVSLAQLWSSSIRTDLPFYLGFWVGGCVSLNPLKQILQCYCHLGPIFFPQGHFMLCFIWARCSNQCICSSSLRTQQLFICPSSTRSREEQLLTCSEWQIADALLQNHQHPSKPGYKRGWYPHSIPMWQTIYRLLNFKP